MGFLNPQNTPKIFACGALVWCNFSKSLGFHAIISKIFACGALNPLKWRQSRSRRADFFWGFRGFVQNPQILLTRGFRLGGGGGFGSFIMKWSVFFSLSLERKFPERILSIRRRRQNSLGYFSHLLRNTSGCLLSNQWFYSPKRNIFKFLTSFSGNPYPTQNN